MTEVSREPTTSAVPSTSGRRPEIVRTIAELRARVAAWRAKGERVAMVPTMGALHEGHLSLVEEGFRRADHVVVSIFVNPTQFAPHEDFQTYPRTETADLAKLAALGTDLVFAPSAIEMYPLGNATRIEMGGPAQGLETDFRPHFFGGYIVSLECVDRVVRPTGRFLAEAPHDRLRGGQPRRRLADTPGLLIRHLAEALLD